MCVRSAQFTRDIAALNEGRIGKSRNGNAKRKPNVITNVIYDQFLNIPPKTIPVLRSKFVQRKSWTEA